MLAGGDSRCSAREYNRSPLYAYPQQYALPPKGQHMAAPSGKRRAAAPDMPLCPTENAKSRARRGTAFLCMGFFDQPQLFLTGKALDLRLPAHGFGPGGEAFDINQRHRTVGAGVFSAPSGVMRRHPPGKIPRPAGVQRAVPAAQDIGVVSLRLSR